MRLPTRDRGFMPFTPPMMACTLDSVATVLTCGEVMVLMACGYGEVRLLCLYGAMARW